MSCGARPRTSCCSNGVRAVVGTSAYFVNASHVASATFISCARVTHLRFDCIARNLVGKTRIDSISEAVRAGGDFIGSAANRHHDDDDDNDDDQEGDADAERAADAASTETGLGGLSTFVARFAHSE